MDTNKIIGQLTIFLFFLSFVAYQQAVAQTHPDEINFVRQGVRRFVFDRKHHIPLASLKPKEIVGMSAMFPIAHYGVVQAEVQLEDDCLVIRSSGASQTAIWFGGFNPFATYTIDLDATDGEGAVGLEFAEDQRKEQYRIILDFKDNMVIGIRQQLWHGQNKVVEETIATGSLKDICMKGKFILQMLGSGLTLYWQGESSLPKPIAQTDFNRHIDLRKKGYMHSLQSRLYTQLEKGEIWLKEVDCALSSGTGQADVRAITYEDGMPLLDQGRLWYTMTIRGRDLPHQLQGVFSLNPTVFDLKFEGIIVFDRQDGILRNEVASHLFYDRKAKIWRGITTGFTAYASSQEHKQLLAVEGKQDPRFGFSVMAATPLGVVGDVEDPHVLFDNEVRKWRILTCENRDGYKAVILESDKWNEGYRRIAGPVRHNSTGTSIQYIDGKRYCFSGSDDRHIYIYSYPDLKEIGMLKMNLPPWDKQSGTRVWPNIVELPEGYPFRFVALMMDRYNYPELTGPNWTYGALYLYHGYLD